MDTQTVTFRKMCVFKKVKSVTLTSMERSVLNLQNPKLLLLQYKQKIPILLLLLFVAFSCI